MKIDQEIADAEARVERLKLQKAHGTCVETGHDWKLLGGKNASCDEDGCGCSVPVHECAKCGDCDYGDNTEADEIRAMCAITSPAPIDVGSANPNEGNA